MNKIRKKSCLSSAKLAQRMVKAYDVYITQNKYCCALYLSTFQNGMTVNICCTLFIRTVLYYSVGTLTIHFTRPIHWFANTEVHSIRTVALVRQVRSRVFLFLPGTVKHTA